MATYSFEISSEHWQEWPPFVDGCPRCKSDAAIVPYSTTTEGNMLVAFYRHRRCDHQWSCRWSAQWSHTWRAA